MNSRYDTITILTVVSQKINAAKYKYHNTVNCLTTETTERRRRANNPKIYSFSVAGNTTHDSTVINYAVELYQIYGADDGKVNMMNRRATAMYVLTLPHRHTGEPILVELLAQLQHKYHAETFTKGHECASSDCQNSGGHSVFPARTHTVYSSGSWLVVLLAFLLGCHLKMTSI